MPNKKVSKQDAWGTLEEHQKAISSASITDLFASDPQRFDNLHVAMDGLLFDYSKHHVSQETIGMLCDFAASCDVTGQRDQMFAGAPVNTTENRAALHPALRGSTDRALEIDGENVAAFVDATLSQIEATSKAIRSNPDITDVVSIGIGGSDLGPRMVCDALTDFADGPSVHFFSNIDGHKTSRLLKSLKPSNTVFIIASKTFETLETMTNAETARDWISNALGETAIADHFYAISANEKAASDFGITAEHILPMRDWIGGRYSVWGAVGLPIAVAFGFDKFQEFLNGAKAADEHFLQSAPEKNIPILMAMLGIWYNHFFGYNAHAVLPYAQSLSQFATFIQQLDMESSGKSVDKDGKALPYPSGPIVFGGAGTNAQHAFFQLLHQGTHIVPADFIAVINPNHTLGNHHTALLANALAQSQALMQGHKNEEQPHRNFDGNRPNSMLMLDRLDPYHLGLLIAFYEHKIFVQGVIWNINSFDQWGVELGKKLAENTSKALESGEDNLSLDPSTNGLVSYIRRQSE